MSTEMETEQITKIPDNLDNKPKSKEKRRTQKKLLQEKLYQNNKEARSALENQNQKQEGKPLTFSYLSNTILTISSLVGAGFTFYQAYKFFYPNNKIKEETNEVVEE